MAVFGVILVLLAAMVVHEAGHFVLCLRLGIPVKSLHLGFPVGPMLRLRLGKYPFTVSPLLFAAAVMIDDEVMWRAPLWKRVLIFLAGPTANFVAVAVVGIFQHGSLAGALSGFLLVGYTAALMIKLAGAVLGGVIPLATLGAQTVGPVGIVALGSGLVSSGAAGYFGFFALISAWLGLTNLLPIPGLDGGQVLTNTLASLGLSRKWVNVLTYACLGMLFAFILVVTVKDVVNLF
ncbi:MAG: site-2 protease family protein [Patescibacteria group bacterium]